MRTNSPRRRSNDFVSRVTDITLIRFDIIGVIVKKKEREREKNVELMKNCRVRFMMQGVEHNRCSP